jgi:hypothetical protein
MRISVELLPGDDDRLEGRVVSDDGRADLTFSGTLDLLRAIEELRHAQSDAAEEAVRTATSTPSETRKEGSSCR